MTAPLEWPYGEAAAALRKAVGPVPRSEYPDLAVARAVARIGERALATGTVEVTDADLKWLAHAAAMMRPPHPFVLGY